ncbi:hypothetical protein SAMN05192551_10426 [Tindallia magadiensis]|uniref:Uncharacterized protein n=1 Tax=Tindallia magadiensis TaxID=69895 RepID=A0A1I3DMP8_9FIRM|nr:hypothetical protein [Tindallia magadiensis]SFH88010.1 hypothetical protein SAMN05192551_10426 [Tindallia magadiensis]
MLLKNRRKWIIPLSFLLFILISLATLTVNGDFLSIESYPHSPSKQDEITPSDSIYSSEINMANKTY